jgi:hypothetical protein
MIDYIYKLFEENKLWLVFKIAQYLKILIAQAAQYLKILIVRQSVIQSSKIPNIT